MSPSHQHQHCISRPQEPRHELDGQLDTPPGRHLDVLTLGQAEVGGIVTHQLGIVREGRLARVTEFYLVEIMVTVKVMLKVMFGKGIGICSMHSTRKLKMISK